MELIRCLIACIALAETGGVAPPEASVVRVGAPEMSVPRDEVFRLPAGSVAVPVRGVAQPVRRAAVAVGLDEPIAEMLVSEGARVRAGQPIARLDDRVARAMLRGAEARAAMTGPVEAAEANLRHARLRHDRVVRAHVEGAASPAELEDAALLVDKARAELVGARESLAIDALRRDELAARLERHTVRAPFSGVVDRVLADAGESPGASAPLVQLVSTARLRVELHVPADWHGRLVPGSVIEFDAGSPAGSVVRARVAAVSPVLDSPTRTMRCVAHISNADGQLPAGLAVSLRTVGPVAGTLRASVVTD